MGHLSKLKFQRFWQFARTFFIRGRKMYTIDWAKNFNGFSDESPMSLQDFILFYDEHIANRYFTYSTTSKKMPYFVIETRPNQIPHLMGLQYWNNIDVKQPGKQYDRLISGKWDIPFLQAADEGSFRDHGWRIEFLGHLYNLLYHHKCTVKLINQTTFSVFKRRRINMVFQKDDSKLVYFLELREKGENTFVPTSLTNYRKGSNALRFKSDPLHISDVLVERNKR